MRAITYIHGKVRGNGMTAFLVAPTVVKWRLRSGIDCMSKGTKGNHGARKGSVYMLARRRRFGGFGKPGKDSGPAPPPPPSEDVQAELEKAASAYGIDTSRKLNQVDEEKQPKTFYGRVEKTVGKEVLNFFEGGLVVGGLGSLVYVLAVGIAVGALAYTKATGSAAPETLITFCDTNEQGMTKALVVFLLCSVTYGAYKYSELQAVGDK